MSLNNVEVFNRWVYTTTSELIAQNIELFNQASRGVILLQAGSNTGDYMDSTFWQVMSNIVRRRNAYGSGNVTPIDLNMILDTMVKVAGGTPPVNIPPVMFAWINKSPQEGAVVIAQQLAPAMLQDMLNTALAGLVAALSNVTDVFTNVSAASGDANKFNPVNTNTALGKFGDRRQAITAWIVHSKQITDFFGIALGNATQLFTYGTVNVVSDPFGNVFVVTDSPSLVITGSPNNYVALGLVPGAAVVQRNDDFISNLDTRNGTENIGRTYQAEWSYNLGLRGFTWDKTSGGPSPTAAALASAANWDKNVTSFKDLAGVALRTQ